MVENNSYPVSLNVDYPAKADRLTSFFRIITVIPIAVVIGLVVGAVPQFRSSPVSIIIGGGGYLFLPNLVMILFRRKYPRWWFDWNVSLVKFAARVGAYFLLLTHEYPSTDEEQSVHIEMPYPDVQKELHPGMPLVKWFLIIPHLFVLYFLFIAVFVCTIIAWFAILFGGRFPKGLFNFVVGVIRWNLRVSAYAFLLTTDKYPPFSLA